MGKNQETNEKGWNTLQSKADRYPFSLFNGSIRVFLKYLYELQTWVCPFPEVARTNLVREPASSYISLTKCTSLFYNCHYHQRQNLKAAIETTKCHHCEGKAEWQHHNLLDAVFYMVYTVVSIDISVCLIESTRIFRIL